MPFGSISIPGITGWNARPKSTSSQSGIEPSNVPGGFGVPSVHDPDPFGVYALEQAGLEIKEAGTLSRPTSDTFEFKPSPSSPLFRQSFQSIDGISRQGSVARESIRDARRDSKRSMLSIDHGTQTADLPSPSPSPKLEAPKPLQRSPLTEEFDLAQATQKDDVEPHIQEPGSEREELSHDVLDDREDDVDSEFSEEGGDGDDSDEEPFAVIELAEPAAVRTIAHTVASPIAVASPTTTRAKLVTIPGRLPPTPPAIPIRSPFRRRFPVKPRSTSDASKNLGSNASSPTPSEDPSKHNADPTGQSLKEEVLLPAMETILGSSNSAPEEDHPMRLPDDGQGPSKDASTSALDEQNVEPIARTATPMLALFRAGLNDTDVDDGDPPPSPDSHQIPKSPEAEPETHSPTSVALPTHIEVEQARLSSRGQAPETDLHTTHENLAYDVPEQTGNVHHDLSNQPHDSPGLDSISSDEDRHSRIRSSAPTEHTNDVSSISDYEDEMTKPMEYKAPTTSAIVEADAKLSQPDI